MSGPDRQRRLNARTLSIALGFTWLLFPLASGIHHMKRDPLVWVEPRDASKPLVVTNKCAEVIYPGTLTSAGTGPNPAGFQLKPGETKSLTVSSDWQGRVWGRTNCSFNSGGTGPAHAGGINGNGAACITGDCGGVVNCELAGWPPATLAEFTLTSGQGQAFYDISLVDGYNLPLGIEALFTESGNKTLEEIPPNLTNPICIGTAALLTNKGTNTDQFFGSNSTYPLPLEQTLTQYDVSRWCPWDLQVSPPDKPGDGVYPYPDDNIIRPAFDPCYSACSKNGDPADCCVGDYGSPSTCSPSLYSKSAKKVCPDAYSYAFDDQTSTFIIPEGSGFGVTFCPAGRSTNILAVLGAELHQVASQGRVTPQQLALLQNTTFINTPVSGTESSMAGVESTWALVLALGALVWQFS